MLVRQLVNFVFLELWSENGEKNMRKLTKENYISFQLRAHHFKMKNVYINGF